MNNNKSAAASTVSTTVAATKWTTEALARLNQAISLQKAQECPYTLRALLLDVGEFMKEARRREVLSALSASPEWKGAQLDESANVVLARVLREGKKGEKREVAWAVGEIMDLIEPISPVTWDKIL